MRRDLVSLLEGKRQQLGISQSAFAKDHLKIDKGLYSKILHQKRGIPESLVGVIAEVLELAVHEVEDMLPKRVYLEITSLSEDDLAYLLELSRLFKKEISITSIPQLLRARKM